MSNDTPSRRIASIDLLRGIAVALMAIDHVRVYSGLPAGGPTPGIFFTRWITHFCAPLFVFLCGTGAYFNRHKLGVGGLKAYLLTRGALLVLLELTVIRFFWSFNPNLTEFVLAGVIWMLGWCMILLAPVVHWRARTVGIVGVAIIVLQPLFALPGRFLPWPWEFVYPSGHELQGAVNVLYVIVPWIGVMAAGFGFGAIMEWEPARRNRLLLSAGLGMTLAWVVMGTIVAQHEANAESPPLLFAVLSQRKYPASPLFLLMTLGPAIALLPTLEKLNGWFAQAMITFGRAPMFYYLLHIPLIHVSALVVGLMHDGAMHPEWYAHAPYTQMPPEAHWTLGLLYLVYAVDVVILYIACRWYVLRKAQGVAAWMRYI